MKRVKGQVFLRSCLPRVELGKARRDLSKWPCVEYGVSVCMWHCEASAFDGGDRSILNGVTTGHQFKHISETALALQHKEMKLSVLIDVGNGGDCFCRNAHTQRWKEFERWENSSELGESGGLMMLFRLGHFRKFLKIWSVWVSEGVGDNSI